MQTLSLRPKYSLNRIGVEGGVAGIPAEAYQAVTTRRYPYPRIGTGAPNGMFPSMPLGEHAVYGRYTSKVSVPHASNPVLRPKFTLDRSQVEGVMPASTYMALTGKITTEPELPQIIAGNGTVEIEHPTSLMFKQPSKPQMMMVQAPSLVWDWGTFLAGSVIGGVTFALLAYGILPALLEAGAKRIRGL